MFLIDMEYLCITSLSSVVHRSGLSNANTLHVHRTTLPTVDGFKPLVPQLVTLGYKKTNNLSTQTTFSCWLQHVRVPTFSQHLFQFFIETLGSFHRTE